MHPLVFAHAPEVDFNSPQVFADALKGIRRSPSHRVVLSGQSAACAVLHGTATGTRVISFRKANWREANRYGKPQTLDCHGRRGPRNDRGRSREIQACRRTVVTVPRRKRGVQGRQKTPTKERITIRLSREVVEQVLESGDGWQTRVDAALREWLKSHSPA